MNVKLEILNMLKNYIESKIESVSKDVNDIEVSGENILVESEVKESCIKQQAKMKSSEKEEWKSYNPKWGNDGFNSWGW